MKYTLLKSLFYGCFAMGFYTSVAVAQNPFITDQYTADPTARVFGDKVYVYPSHDILATKERGRQGWFCMEDYHVFSSSNLVDWTDHGVIVTQNKVDWVKPDSYSMWAPDCIFRNGKYYFYFPSSPKDTTIARGFTIGVAIADKPEGPFIPQSTPIKDVKGIDPNVFIDKDGQAYLYWSQGHIFGAKLKENMLELDSEVKILGDLPTKGLKEGPFVFERAGKYYMTYPHVENKIERLEYAVSDNPLGPFKITGVIMDESETGCWTNHQSIVEFQNQWYLFYHHNDISPNFDKARSIRVDSLFFNEDGTIQKVKPTLRGVGISSVNKPIQIDRFSTKSSSGFQVALLDTTDKFKGWKAVLDEQNAWGQYNTVDFGKTNRKKGTMRVAAKSGAKLELRVDGPQGPILAEVKVPANQEWTNVSFPVTKYHSGTHHLVVLLKDSQPVEVDWIKFD